MLCRSRLKFNIQRVMGRLHLHVQHPANRVFSAKQIQLNVLLVLTTIQLAPCTNYIKLIQVWFSSYIPTTRFHDLPG